MIKAFVYGALMVTPQALKNGRAAIAPNHSISFKLGGLAPLEPSFAILEESEGETAWGVVVDYTAQEWRRILQIEKSYHEKTILVKTKDGVQHKAIALAIETAKKALTRKMPSARYSGLLLRGAKYHGFPPTVIKKYRRLSKQGNKFSLVIFPFVKPLMFLLIKKMSPKKAFYISLITFFLVILIILFAIGYSIASLI